MKINEKTQLIIAVAVIAVLVLGFHYVYKPLRAKNYFNQYISLKEQGNLDAAYRKAQEAYDIYESPEFLYEMGVTSLELAVAERNMREKQSRYERTINYLNNYTGRMPDDYRGYSALGSAWLYVGREISPNYFPEAVKNLKKAVSLAPENIEMYRNLATALYLTGEEEQAVEIYEELIEKAPNDADALFNLGIIYYEQNNYKKAAGYWEKSLEINPQNPQVQAALRMVYEVLNN